MGKTSFWVREDINRKKLFFRALPESPKPPPSSPQFGQLGPLFSDVKNNVLRVWQKTFPMLIMMVIPVVDLARGYILLEIFSLRVKGISSPFKYVFTVYLSLLRKEKILADHVYQSRQSTIIPFTPPLYL